MNLKPFLISALILLVFTSFAQTYHEQLTNLKNLTPPSPEAASLGKYGETPISLYTGIPQISIPIYELKRRSISVPISISYHASGVKVGEIASSVGLQWALNAGGIITRSVAGLPDDIPTNGFLDYRATLTYPLDMSPIGIIYLIQICS